MNKTAKEMFKELGYKAITDKDSLESYIAKYFIRECCFSGHIWFSNGETVRAFKNGLKGAERIDYPL